MQSYSFIKPRKKEFFKKLIKIWLGYHLATILILILTTISLWYKIDSTNAKQEDLANRSEILKSEAVEIEKSIELIEKEKRFAGDVFYQNELLKESIKNLFELIPDQITLSSVEMDRDVLVIKGMTPSKEVYNFLLAVPLKSIFNDSTVDFYMIQNGWYNFISVNRLEEE